MEAIKKFRRGKADVLVATDVAAKGLDFQDVQHVINYDMPKEVSCSKYTRLKTTC